MTDKRRESLQDLMEAMGNLKALFSHGHEPLLMKHGIGMPHFKLMLRMAASEDGASVSQLAAAARVTPGAITQFIDRLVDSGLVERFEDPKDRRVVRIRLTAKARKRFQKMKEFHFERLAKAFRNLSDPEIAQLAELLRKIEIGPEDMKRGTWKPIKRNK